MRNKTHSFAATPEIDIRRSRFDMPCNVKFTGNTGVLIPFYVAEVLPGDTFNVSTSIVCRLQTLLHPLMDNIYLDTYYFYVPNRLVWDNWQRFCGEPDRAWLPSEEKTVPQINVSWYMSDYDGEDQAAKYINYIKESFKDSIIDYMGIGIAATRAPNMNINALPIRAYNKIFDDWFRDENLEDPVNLYTGDLGVNLFRKTDYQNPLNGGKCYNACKLHDYFTSALPEAQRGNPASLVTGDPITSTVKTASSVIFDNPSYAMHMQKVSQGDGSFMKNTVIGTTNAYERTAKETPSTNENGLYPDNLYVDLSNLNLGISVNDLRLAFQVQKFMEKSARGGARYIEILKSMFGVTSPDARLQRSEYLGGHRVPINIHQVVNQSESATAFLGNTGAMSVTSDVHNDFVHSFVEHGFVIGICTVRYKHTYPQGMDRFWTRSTKFDYYWPVFANIGEQPIKNKEIYISSQTIDGQSVDEMVFGYQEAWADYRYKPNRVMGEMRPGIPSTLASWHLADYYTSVPTLGSSWIKEDIAPVDRAIAVSSSVADQFLFDILINNNCTRPMPLYSIPGLVDHF